LSYSISSRRSETWRSTPLSDLLTAIESGGRPRGGVRGIHKGVPSIGGEHIAPDGTFRLENMRYVTEEFAKTRTRGWICQSDILVVKDGATTGKTAFVSPTFPFSRAMINEHVIRCSVSEAVSAKYLFLFLISEEGQSKIRLDFRGTAQGGISLKFAEKIMIPLPPYAEQQRIVAMIEGQFTRLNVATDWLQRTRLNLTRLRSSILRASFIDFPTRRFGDLLREPLRNGKSSPQSSSGSVKVLTLTAVTEGDFSDKHTKLTNLGSAQVENLWLRPGDILIERSNTPELVGTARQYQGPLRWAIFPDLIIRARLGKHMLPRFAELALQSAPLRQYFKSRAKGIAGSMPKIDQTTVREAQLPIASVDEQRRVVGELDSRFAIIDATDRAVEAALTRAAKLQQLILRDAFAGRLVPLDASDQPAASLLERIKTEVATP